MISEFNNLAFHCFINNKIDIAFPNITNIAIWIMFSIAIILTIQRRDEGTGDILNRSETDALKGVAILAVVIGHLWEHVAATEAAWVFAKEAVSMFLLLSGFGVSLSFHDIVNRKFIKKRITRIFLPYWVATIALLLLDYFLLNKSYSIKEIFATFLGYNYTKELRHLDYARWFVTFILFCYTAFLIMANVTRDKGRFILLLSITIIASFFVHYYFIVIGWYQFFAFPVGCAIGLYYNTIKNYFIKYSRLILSISFVYIIFILAFKFLTVGTEFGSELQSFFPAIGIKITNEINGIMTSLASIAILHAAMKQKYYSSFLNTLGKYSYEIFLLHGAFLVKYNPFFMDDGFVMLSIEFIPYFSFLLFISYGLSKLSSHLNSKLFTH